MMTIKKVGIFSLAKMLGGLYTLLGLIVGSLFSCISLLGFTAATASMAELGGGEAFMSLVFGVGAIIILPVFYGIMGFIGGLIVAVLYNLLAGVLGGIEIETA